MQKLYICKILFRYSSYFFVILIFDFFFDTNLIPGIYFISTSLIFCMKLLKRKMLMTPFLVGEVLLVCFALYQLHLVQTMNEMELESSLIILFCIFWWQVISAFNRYNFYEVDKLVYNLRPAILKLCTYGLFFLSALFIGVEWVRAGSIPAFQSNAEMMRFDVSFNAVWHIIAMSIKYVPMFACFFWMANGKISMKRDKGLIMISILCLMILVGTAQRGELLSGPVIIFFALCCYKKPSIRGLILPIILIVLVMAVYPILRGYNAYGLSYIYDIKLISAYPNVWFITPLYQTFANSFHILNRDFNTFPSQVNFGFGNYTLWCNVPFVDLADSLAIVQNRAWNNGFYSELTPTFFGDWYADFGYPGCFIGITLIALLLNLLYKNYVKKRDAMSLSLYALNFYKCICMLYDNTFDFVWLTYLCLLWFVFRLSRGTVKERR